MFWPRGKTLGGSSSLNAQMYVRGNSLDYDHWADLGNKGWAYGDVLPYFERSERSERGTAPRRGTSGPLNIADLRDPNPTTVAFLEAAVEAGVARSKDINGPDQDGIDATQVTQKRGRRWSAADAYLKPARKRRNLTVATGAHTRADRPRRHSSGWLSSTSRTAGAASAGERGASSQVVRSTPPSCSCCRESVPPISSPRSRHSCRGGPARCGEEPARPPRHHGHRALEGAGDARGRRVAPNLARFLTLGRGMLTSNVGEACGFVRTRPELDAPDLELIFAPVPFIDHGLAPPPGHGITIGSVAVTPRSRGELTLRSADPFAAPRIEPNYLSDPDGEDLRVLVEGSKIARRIFDAPAARTLCGRSAAAARYGLRPTTNSSSTFVATRRRCTTQWVPARWAPTISRWSIPS